MSGLAAVLRRAGELLVEPAPPPPRPAAPAPLEVVVTGLGARAGATTVARGVALALRRLGPVELAGPGRPGAVAAGPGTAVVRDTAPADTHLACHHGTGRMLVAVADGRREAALAALVLEVLTKRHERVVLVANRVRDVSAWQAAGALCVPESRLGAWLLGRGRRPPGAMGAALVAIAVHVRQAP